jgi:type III restriction enzyme
MPLSRELEVVAATLAGKSCSSRDPDDASTCLALTLRERRREEFITPIPKSKKCKREQRDLVFDEGKGLSTGEQQYDSTPVINELRQRIDYWRGLPNSRDWKVTHETAYLLQHWRRHKFNSIRPFFGRLEAAEAAIWLPEVA